MTLSVERNRRALAEGAGVGLLLALLFASALVFAPGLMAELPHAFAWDSAAWLPVALVLAVPVLLVATLRNVRALLATGPILVVDGRGISYRGVGSSFSVAWSDIAKVTATAGSHARLLKIYPRDDSHPTRPQSPFAHLLVWALSTEWPRGFVVSERVLSVPLSTVEEAIREHGIEVTQVARPKPPIWEGPDPF